MHYSLSLPMIINENLWTKYKSNYPRTLQSKKEQVDYRGTSRLGEATHREICFLFFFFLLLFSCSSALKAKLHSGTVARTAKTLILKICLARKLGEKTTVHHRVWGIPEYRGLKKRIH